MSGPDTYGMGDIYIADTPESREAYRKMREAIKPHADVDVNKSLLTSISNANSEIEITSSTANGVRICGYNGNHYGYSNSVNLEGLLNCLKNWADDGFIELTDENLSRWKLEIKNHKLYKYKGEAQYSDKQELS